MNRANSPVLAFVACLCYVDNTLNLKMRCVIIKKEAKLWFVYILECADDTFYVGMTTDVKKRVKAHNTTNASRYTRARRPVKLKYFEQCEDRPTAAKRERSLKKYTRAKKLDLIKTFKN
jgi:putative endonuclease